MCPIRFQRVRTPRPRAIAPGTTARALLAVTVAVLLAGAPTAGAQPPNQSIPLLTGSASQIVALGNIATEIESEDPSLASRSDSLRPRFLPLPPPELRAHPHNLGALVNSSGTELGPVISPDGRTLYFTRGGARGNQDIWYSRVDSLGMWSQASRMPDPLTNAYNNFVESVTPDGNTLLVGGRYLGNKTIVSGAALSHRTRDGWSTPEPLRIRNYYSRSRSVSSCLGSDGGTIIMSLDRDGGRGRQDLHVSFRTPNGEWTEPMNLGAMVNTSEVDFAPFLAADGVTLYFASKGHRGYGDADIFVTRRLDSTWQTWSTPTNLGPTINSDAWDAYYVIPASGEHVYYGSANNAIGESDIVRVPLPKDVRPQPVALVSGRVVDRRTNEPLAATILYETLPNGIEAGTARTDPRTGSYAIALPAGQAYAFRAEADGYLGIGDNVDLTSLDSYTERSTDLAMIPFEEGQVITLQNLFFDSGESNLRSESFPELERLAGLLVVNPTLEIEVSGHTDGVGSAVANERLSDARVASVVAWLVAQGVPQARLHSARYGESKPIAPNDSDEGRQRNRRVEFTIVRR